MITLTDPPEDVAAFAAMLDDHHPAISWISTLGWCVEVGEHYVSEAMIRQCEWSAIVATLRRIGAIR